MIDVCSDCGNEIEIASTIDELSRTINNIRLVNEELNSRQFNVPFHCLTCGAIKFPYRAILDHVFIYPTPLPERYGNSKMFIPDNYKRHYRNWIGIVLHVGPGCYLDSGSFKHTQLRIGQRVVYDKTVPWNIDVEDSNGQVHKVIICGELDVRAVLGEGDDLHWIDQARK